MLYEKDCLSCSFENTERRGLGEEPLDYVIPAWTAGIQVNMDVSGRILANLMDAANPCRHDEAPHFHVRWASISS